MWRALAAMSAVLHSTPVYTQYVCQPVKWLMEADYNSSPTLAQQEVPTTLSSVCTSRRTGWHGSRCQSGANGYSHLLRLRSEHGSESLVLSSSAGQAGVLNPLPYL